MVKEDKAGFIRQIHNALKQGTNRREAEEEKSKNETCASEVVPVCRRNSHLPISMGHDLRWRTKRF